MQLWLQDLNRGDIREYVLNFFHKNEGVFRNVTDIENLPSYISDEIVYKSEGVFLWAHPALKYLQRGIDRSESREALFNRPRRFPKGLYNLY
jgi:hypothetical protein